jgi:hypothetical protein
MRRGLLLFLVGLGTLVPRPVLAQTTSGQSASQEPRWSIEAYGGLTFGRWSGGGGQTLPAAGAPIATSSPVFPSWSVPTWFLGDGASFLNNVAGEFGITNRLTPLDAALTTKAIGAAGQLLTGVRITRALQAPWEVEFAAEVAAQSAGISDDTLTSFDATAESFRATFTELFTTGPFTAPVVTAGAASAAGGARDVTLTVALRTPMAPLGGFDTYAIAGGGVVFPIGDPAAVAIEGKYRFRIAGAVQIDETDSLTVQYRGRTTFVAVFGGGFERVVGGRLGVRIDARALAGPATTKVEVSSAPAIVTATPAGFIESFTYPNLQFSNNASTGRRSTLGSPGLDSVAVFSGGWSIRARATAGVFFRF